MRAINGELAPGQQISYPVRHGSFMYVRRGEVVEVLGAYILVKVQDRWSATEPRKVVKVWRTDRVSILASERPVRLSSSGQGLTFPSSAITFTRGHNKSMMLPIFQETARQWQIEQEEARRARIEKALRTTFNRLLGGC